MSVHLSDRQLLAELIRLGECVLSGGVMPAPMSDLNSLAGDVVAALRCPGATAVGAVEAILFTALQKLSTGGTASPAELARLAFIAQQALAIVRDHYFAIVKAEAIARARGRA